jgi:mono/diheme cytochrome c family protein
MTIRTSVLGGVVFVVAAAAACGADKNAAPGVPIVDIDASSDAAANVDENTGINTTGVGAGTGADTGLPCDIQQILENYCIACHLAGSAMGPLLTYDDLLKPSTSDPHKTMAVRALERMSDPNSPMPPKPAVAPNADEIATWKAWIDAQTPKATTTCTDKPPAAGDAGTVFNTPTVCTSNTFWKGGNGGDDDDNGGTSTMHPGVACITCHTIQGGPSFKIAGTVYPTAHEPNDCDGVKGGLTVIVTDAHGKDTPLTVNSAGNFYSESNIKAPFHVRVTNGTKVRAMNGSLTAGDCNSCHTVAGANGAPGRILAP